ncbi:Ferredoxin, 2Fe-2S [Anoxybacillus sp. BCO1]|nr:Ferredoxin, 2Fe-2S [Anoxybacillus sp. BCO1]
MATWNLQGTKHHILICNGASCMRKGGEEVTQAIRDEIDQLQIHAYVHTTRTRCNGRCEDACVVIVYPEGVWYRTIDEALRGTLSENTYVMATCYVIM